MSDIKLILDDLKDKYDNQKSFLIAISNNIYKDDIVIFINNYFCNIRDFNNIRYKLSLYYNSASPDTNIKRCPICNKPYIIDSKNRLSSKCSENHDNRLIYNIDNKILDKKLSNIRESSKTEKQFAQNIKKDDLYKTLINRLSELYNITEYLEQLLLYCYFNNIDTNFSIPKCKCGKNCKHLYGITFRKTCGDKKCTVNSRVFTNLEKYKTEYYSQTDECKEKVRNTNIRKIGYSSNFLLPDFSKTAKNTMLKKYGNEYFSKTALYRDKVKQTNLNKYGFDSYTKTSEYREKSKLTYKRKYGSSNITKSEYYKKLINNRRYKKYLDTIKRYNLPLILEGNKCLCENCGNTFNVDDIFIKQRFNYHTNIICPFCYPKNFTYNSNGQKELYNFIKTLILDDIVENYVFEGKSSIDIYIPYKNIGFEFNGLYWHSEACLKNYDTYHSYKTKTAQKRNMRLIHIWEDDWNYKQEIVKSRIRNLLGKTEKRVYARQTIIKEVSYQDCKQFLDENHIQGCGTGNIRCGLFYKDELVSVIQIDKSGLLSRFANKLNTNVIGGFSKLFKYCEEYIKYTFVDLDWSSENNIYSRYMKFDSYVEPTWYLLYKGKRVHRRNFQKKKLLQMGMGSPEQTEHEITLENKLYRIYNSGNIKYVKQNS